jgi:hypothetical protein
MDAFVVYSDRGVEAACHFWHSQQGASQEAKTGLHAMVCLRYRNATGDYNQIAIADL